MRNYIRPARLFVLAFFVALILGLYIMNLYDIQIINSPEASPLAGTTTTTYRTIGDRGDIVDRNGTLLVSSEAVYNIKLKYSEFKKADDMCGEVLRLVQTAIERNIEYTDTFPITKMPTFAYTDMSSSQEYRLQEYLKHYELDENISPTDLIVWMKEHYGIDYTTSLYETRLILGVLYEMEIRTIINTSEYIFVSDADLEYISLLLESGFPGIELETKMEREYHTAYAAHILGRVGLMTAEEYEDYKELDYPMDATVGKDGVELAFEEYLHGTDGTIKVRRDDETGAVVDVTVTEEAQAGSNVALTIDIGLQAAAENALTEIIESIGEDREEGDKPSGGALVVLDVDTSSTLALANYPTYDITTLSENYSRLASDPSAPLFNRATMGQYNPGSTFKMVIAYAGLLNNKIDLTTTIYDESRYTEYEDYQPRCWVYPDTHGFVDVIGSLAQSCNYFYYSLGDELGIKPITNAALAFGFGEPTGIEITENPGTVASPEAKKEASDLNWFAADTLLAAIGQGYTYCTPTQLANYAACIANGGNLHKVTLLEEVLSPDYLSVEETHETELLNTISNYEGYISTLQEGMEAVVAQGTGRAHFSGYPIKVAAKTGTVQSSSTTFNNAVFVCYAPADDPEIAIAVVIEKGGSGSSVIPAAKDVLDYYFADRYTASENTENDLLR